MCCWTAVMWMAHSLYHCQPRVVKVFYVSLQIQTKPVSTNIIVNYYALHCC